MKHYFIICFSILFIILALIGDGYANHHEHGNDHHEHEHGDDHHEHDHGHPKGRTMSDEEREKWKREHFKRGGFGPCKCRSGPGKFCGWEIGCDCDTIYKCEKINDLATPDTICLEEGRQMGKSCSSYGKPKDAANPPRCKGESKKP